MKTKTVERDARDYDTTQLREAGHGRTLHRDYSAHFFRWAFARRLIKRTNHVLEIGCGQDRPLSKILTGVTGGGCHRYVGVDLNKVKASESQRLTFHGEFNFNERWKELLTGEQKDGFDVIVHLEVIEHMKVIHGRKLLKAAHKCLKDDGIMLMSTPCYDGVRHAANHIHEYTIEELAKETKKAGFEVVGRYGTFMDIKHIGKVDPSMPDAKSTAKEIMKIRADLSRYYDNDAISCFFAPFYPDEARNNLWVCKKL